MPPLDKPLEARLIALATTLVDQHRARPIVWPQQNQSGFWFGGGNLIEDAAGSLWLVGRYRNAGDSRTGLSAGQRGLELAIFRSEDRGHSFQKRISFSKQDLNVPQSLSEKGSDPLRRGQNTSEIERTPKGLTPFRTGSQREVLSIEGSALHQTEHGIELFVSTEKSGIAYPTEFAEYLKPGTGVWTIERLQAASIDGLKSAVVQTVLESTDPATLHVKDPVVYDAANGDLVLMYCTHPFCWSSSNTAYATRPRGSDQLSESCCEFFPRGLAWDIAITRGTGILDVPKIGPFADRQVSLLFYDGGESLRNLDEHEQAVRRPRGYSCEELGGVAYFLDGDLRQVYRLSRHHPFFISPWGTGCSRYVDVLTAQDGLYVTWQQSQTDFSQPLVMNIVRPDDVARCLE